MPTSKSEDVRETSGGVIECGMHRGAQPVDFTPTLSRLFFLLYINLTYSEQKVYYIYTTCVALVTRASKCRAIKKKRQVSTWMTLCASSQF